LAVCRVTLILKSLFQKRKGGLENIDRGGQDAVANYRQPTQFILVPSLLLRNQDSVGHGIINTYL